MKRFMWVSDRPWPQAQISVKAKNRAEAQVFFERMRRLRPYCDREWEYVGVFNE